MFLTRISNKLPQDIIRHIKSYLPQAIVLCAITIPNQTLSSMMSTLKVKNIKYIYACMKKQLSGALSNRLYAISSKNIIRFTDVNVLGIRCVNRQKKQKMIEHLTDICYKYNLILNVVSKVKSNYSSIIITYCAEVTQMIQDNLTYMYKLITFASKPELNKRAKSKATKNKNPIEAEE
jgi:hypothetical protein